METPEQFDIASTTEVEAPTTIQPSSPTGDLAHPVETPGIQLGLTGPGGIQSSPEANVSFPSTEESGQSLFPAESAPAHVETGENQQSLSELYSRINEMSHDANKLKLEVKSLETSLAVERANSKQLTTNFKAKEVSMNAVIASLKTENMQLSDNFKRIQQKNAELYVEVSNANSLKEEAQKSISDSQQKIASMEMEHKKHYLEVLELKQKYQHEQARSLSFSQTVEKLNTDLKDRDATMSALYEKKQVLEDQILAQAISTDTFSTSEMEKMMQATTEQIQILHDQYAEIIREKDNELELMKKSAETLERKMSRIGERASSTYSGEGTEHVSNPKEDLMKKFKSMLTVNVGEIRAKSRAHDPVSRDREFVSKTHGETAETFQEMVRDAIKKDAGRNARSSSDKETDYLNELLRNAGLDPDQARGRERNEPEREDRELASILRGRSERPRFSDRGSTREPSSSNRASSASRSGDGDKTRPHDKIIKAVLVFALAKYHDNTAVDEKAFSTFRIREISKNMVELVAMSDGAMGIDISAVQYLFDGIDDDEMTVRMGADGRGDHAMLGGPNIEYSLLQIMDQVDLL